GAVRRLGQSLEREILGKTPGQEQPGALHLFGMQARGRRARQLGLRAPWLSSLLPVAAPQHAAQEPQRRLFELQLLPRPRERRSPQQVLPPECARIARDLWESKQPFGGLRPGWIPFLDRLPRQAIVKHEDGAIIATAARVGHAIALLTIEEQHLVDVREQPAAARLALEDATARKYDLVRERPLLRAPLQVPRAAADVVDRNARRVVQRLDAQRPQGIVWSRRVVLGGPAHVLCSCPAN